MRYTYHDNDWYVQVGFYRHPQVGVLFDVEPGECSFTLGLGFFSLMVVRYR